MLKEVTLEQYEELWQMAKDYTAHSQLIEGSWVAPSLTVELFKTFCKTKGYRLPRGLVGGRRG